MKIIGSIRRCYLSQYGVNIKLKDNIDSIITNAKEDAWHYFSRIKSQESYALKIETGRVVDLKHLDDFFACTIVVENNSEIKKAIELVNRFFDIVSRRPRTENFTQKSPDSFPYDNLRLYVKLKYDEGLAPEFPSNKLSDILFEIQIKTFLQHAWDVSTHDLIYKGDEISWPKRRIAYQTKAMLEQAEISIYEIDKIKKSNMLAKRDKKTTQLNKVKKFLTNNWSQDNLPNDLIRLSESVNFFLEQLKINTAKLQRLLNAESNDGRGTKTLNLSPYFIIVQTIINRDPELIRNFLSDKVSPSRIVIPIEIDTGEIVLDEDKIIRIDR